MPAKLAPNSAKLGAISNFGLAWPVWAMFVQIVSNSEVGQIRCNFDLVWSELDHRWIDVGQSWVDFGQIWQKLAKFGPMPAEFPQYSTELGPIGPFEAKEAPHRLRNFLEWSAAIASAIGVCPTPLFVPTCFGLPTPIPTPTPAPTPNSAPVAY